MERLRKRALNYAHNAGGRRGVLQVKTPRSSEGLRRVARGPRRVLASSSTVRPQRQPDARRLDMEDGDQIDAKKRASLRPPNARRQALSASKCGLVRSETKSTATHYDDRGSRPRPPPSIDSPRSPEPAGPPPPAGARARGSPKAATNPEVRPAFSSRTPFSSNSPRPPRHLARDAVCATRDPGVRRRLGIRRLELGNAAGRFASKLFSSYATPHSDVLQERPHFTCSLIPVLPRLRPRPGC